MLRSILSLSLVMMLPALAQASFICSHIGDNRDAVSDEIPPANTPAAAMWVSVFESETLFLPDLTRADPRASLLRLSFRDGGDAQTVGTAGLTYGQRSAGALENILGGTALALAADLDPRTVRGTTEASEPGHIKGPREWRNPPESFAPPRDALARQRTLQTAPAQWVTNPVIWRGFETLPDPRDGAPGTWAAR